MNKLNTKVAHYVYEEIKKISENYGLEAGKLYEVDFIDPDTGLTRGDWYNNVNDNIDTICRGIQKRFPEVDEIETAYDPFAGNRSFILWVKIGETK